MLGKVFDWLKGLPWWAWLLGVPVVIAVLAVLGRAGGGLLGVFVRQDPAPQSPGVSPAEGEKRKAEATSIADAAVKAAENYAAGEKAELGKLFGPGEKK